MKPLRTVYLATKNDGKRREFAAMLQGFLDVRSLNELGQDPHWEETGETFAENALIKARAIAALTNHWVLADDSGLEVDELQGLPGVNSARWAGSHGDEEACRQKVLASLTGVPGGKRTARFVCSLALIDDNKKEHLFEGFLEGTISEAPRGTKGFGYDSLFIPKGGTQTLAELESQEKNSISHRHQALHQLKQFLQEV